MNCLGKLKSLVPKTIRVDSAKSPKSPKTAQSTIFGHFYSALTAIDRESTSYLKCPFLSSHLR